MKRIALIMMAMMASVAVSFAQADSIIYVDLHNERVRCKIFDFDFNQDFFYDLRFCCHLSNTTSFSGPPIFEVSNVYYMAGSGIVSPYDACWSFRLRAEENDTISMLNDWKYCFSHYLFGETPYGSGQGPIHEDFHTAIRNRQPDGSYCYGWIHYRVDAETDFPNSNDLSNCWITFYEYAYCTIPGYPLRVGQTSFSWGVEEAEASAFATVHPNPTTGKIHIEGEKATEIQVFNALGQLVKTVQNTNEVGLEGQPQGLYLLRVTLEGGKVFSDKVVKE